MTREAPRTAGGTTVAAASAVGNVLAYALSVVFSRGLGREAFGEAAALLALVLVASVLGQALQAGIARQVATAADGAADVRGLLLRSALVGAGVAGVLALLSPVLRAVLDLAGWAALLWTASSLLPVTLAFAAFGVLQGAERFARLSAALVVLQVGRLSGGALGVLLGGSTAAAMAGTALGMLAAAVVCVGLCRPGRGRAGPGTPLLAGLVRDTTAVLAVLALTNVDVLLARALLPADDAGLYAAGALVAKMAYFAPSFVVPVLYARLSRRAERGRALRTGAAVVAGSAVLATGGALVAAPLLPVVVGEEYAPVQDVAWAFAAAGSALAAVFLLVQAGLAVHDRRLAVVAWAVVVVEVVAATVLAEGVRSLVAVVLAGALVVVLTGALLERRPARRDVDDAPPATGPAVA